MTPAERHAYALRSLAHAKAHHDKCLHDGPLHAFGQAMEAYNFTHWQAHVTGLRAFRWRAHQRLTGAALAGREGT